MERMDILVGSKRGDKMHWTKVGAAFPAKSGEGFDLVINEGIAVHGRVILRPVKAREDRPAQNPTSVGADIEDEIPF